MIAERERDRAVRIAYTHARAGDAAGARRWLELAGMFAAPTRRQERHVDTLLRAAGPFIHPAQLELADALERRARELARAR